MIEFPSKRRTFSYHAVKDPFGFQKFGRFHYVFSAIICYIQMISSFRYSRNEIIFVSNLFCELTNLPALSKPLCDERRLIYVEYLISLLSTTSGSFACFFLDRRVGRKDVIYMGLTMYFVGTVVGLMFLNPFGLLAFIFCDICAMIMCQTAARVLLIEIIPYKSIDFISGLLVLSNYIGSMLYMIFKLPLKFWHWMLLLKFATTIVAASIVVILPESPRWHFLCNDTERSIEILENIALINGKNPEGIRDGVEQAWRETRVRPKSRNNFFDLFYYPELTSVFFKTGLSFLIGTFSYALASDLSLWPRPSTPTIQKLVNIAVQIITVGYYWILTKYYGRKKCIMVGLTIDSGVFALLALVPGELLLFVFGKFAMLVSGVVFLNIETVILELSPTSLRVPIIVIFNYFISTAAVMGLKPLIMVCKVLWMPPIISSLMLLLCAFLMADIAETKGHSVPASTREAEMYLKDIVCSTRF